MTKNKFYVNTLFSLVNIYPCMLLFNHKAKGESQGAEMKTFKLLTTKMGVAIDTQIVSVTDKNLEKAMLSVALNHVEPTEVGSYDLTCLNTRYELDLVSANGGTSLCMVLAKAI